MAGGTVRAVTRPEAARGFRLAGLPVRSAPDAEAAETAVRHWSSRADVAVILVQRSLFDEFSEALLRSVTTTAVPVVVPFPDPTWEETGPAEEWVVELLRRAVGYRVQLR